LWQSAVFVVLETGARLDSGPRQWRSGDDYTGIHAHANQRQANLAFAGVAKRLGGRFQAARALWDHDLRTRGKRQGDKPKCRAAVQNPGRHRWPGTIQTILMGGRSTQLEVRFTPKIRC